MTIGVAGQYKWLRYHPVYHREQVALMLPVAFGEPPWTEARRRPIENCKRGDRSCKHKCERDQWDEGCLYDGEHADCLHQHNGHDRCGVCVCIDPAAIRGGGDGRESDAEVIRIDLEIALSRVRMSSEIHEALELRHRYGFSQDEIGRRTGTPQRTVSDRLAAGHKKIADYLNGVSR
jgi:hypothetical protein